MTGEPKPPLPGLKLPMSEQGGVVRDARGTPYAFRGMDGGLWKHKDYEMLTAPDIDRLFRDDSLHAVAKWINLGPGCDPPLWIKRKDWKKLWEREIRPIFASSIKQRDRLIDQEPYIAQLLLKDDGVALMFQREH